MGSNPAYKSCLISFYYFRYAEGHTCVVLFYIANNIVMDNAELIPHTSIGLNILAESLG